LCQLERIVLDNRLKHLLSRRLSQRTSSDEISEQRHKFAAGLVVESGAAMQKYKTEGRPLQKRRGLGQSEETRRATTDGEEDGEITVDFRLDELFQGAPAVQGPAHAPTTTPSTRDDSNVKQKLLINRFISRSGVSKCERNLFEADADGNNRLDRDEYATFVDLESGGEIERSFGELGAAFIALFYAVACSQCYEDTGGDDNCCLGEKAFIALPESSRGEDEWILFLCSCVDEVIDDEIGPQPEPTPSPLESPRPTVPPVTTEEPTRAPEESPSREPSAASSPTAEPTKTPVADPTDDPAPSTSLSPTLPTDQPSAQTRTPTSGPSGAPAATSQAPSTEPTSSPFSSQVPSGVPSEAPAVTSLVPSTLPTGSPIASEVPSNIPSEAPVAGSEAPSSEPSSSPVAADIPTSAPAASASPVASPENNTLCVDFFYSVRNTAGLSAQDILDESNNTLKTGLEIATRNVTIEILNATFPRSSRTLETADAASATSFGGGKRRRTLALTPDAADATTSAFSDARFREARATTAASYASRGLYESGQERERAVTNGLSFEFGDEAASRMLRSLWDAIASSSAPAPGSTASNDNRMLSRAGDQLLERQGHRVIHTFSSRHVLQLSKQGHRSLVYYTDVLPPTVTNVIDDPFCPGGGGTVGGGGGASNGTVQCAFVSTQVCVVLEPGDDPDEIERALDEGFRIAIQDGSFFDAIPAENIP
jgi:hypothetical protein